ncbi:MAG: hypothetical protein ABSF91_09185 [Bacteroidota bacterium]
MTPPLDSVTTDPRSSMVSMHPKSNRTTPGTFTMELIFYCFLIYVFCLAADRYADAMSFRQPSMIIFVFHSIFLFIHEGGHFLFSLFGRTLHILGGSFWQVMFPFLSFLLALRSSDRIAPFPLFLTGFNLMGVSLYMRDAPLRQLALLGGDKSRHDWFNLFTQWGVLDSAETIADITYYLGFIVCLGSILAGFYLAYRSFFNPKVVADGKLQLSLDEVIEKEEMEPKSPGSKTVAPNNNPFGI